MASGHMDLSRFFIDRPIFAGVLSIVIFTAGLIAIPNIPVSEYPEVVPPSVMVRRQYPGANPRRPSPKPSPHRSRSRSTASRTCSTWLAGDLRRRDARLR